jgi:uncharacterized protein (TIGR00255 family)
MLRSMTGFGAAAHEDERGFSLRVEIRSVNHRHLSIKTRLPEGLAALEHEVEGRVRAACERGALSVHVAAERHGAARPARLDLELARRYRAELDELARALGLPATLPLEALLALPGVVAAEEGSGLPREVEERLLELVDRALAELLAMRAAEGAALLSDLRKHALASEKLVQRVEKRMPTVVRAHRESLRRRVRELLGPGAAPAALAGEPARELALLADRLDVSEEIARLKSHLTQLERSLARGGRIGRQLDFLVQEIFREVNTIGAKCADARVAHWVVEAKTHVERLREQVQNVE